MVYQGSKNKLSKHLKPIIESYIKSFNNVAVIYVEPFVGGANMIDKIEWDKKTGLDNNKFLIELLKTAQASAPLPLLNSSRDEYNKWRDKFNTRDYTSQEEYLIGYYGFLGSFNGRFYSGGYGAIDKHGKNMLKQRLNNLNKQAEQPQFKNIDFRFGNYKNFVLDGASDYVLYLDPPYQNVKEYGAKFNHEELWEQCKKWKEQNKNCIILLSELQAPEKYWECIWEQEHQYTLRDKNNKNKKVVEKLFIWRK